MPFADLRGTRLFFTDEGASADPMVFVHGFSCDSHDWSWQLPHFASTHRVVAVDLRGHGRSSAPDDGYQVQSLSADLLAVVDHLGCGPVVVVGHSLGGAIVASMAAERPEHVLAVVAVDPAHLRPDEHAPGLAAALAAYQAEDPGAVASQFFDAGSHVTATPSAIATWHNRRAAGVPAHVLRKTMAGLLGGGSPFILQSTSAPLLRRVSCPVLSLYADPERVTDTDGVFTNPKSRTLSFPGSGHWLHQERPIEINSLIDSWLADLRLPS
jgi:pimeloyl-ACP methyl ester carboxylesterase